MKYVSLCCIIKNEIYLEEFIIYHHSIGVEHFYIYDNESDIPIKNRLNNFYFNRLCTIIDFPGKSQQMNAYNHCVKNYGNNTNWLIVIDGDEYIFPKDPYFKIGDFLRNYEEYHAIGINWQIFGSNFHSKIQAGLCTDKYIRCENNQNEHVKSIVKPKYVKLFDNPHYAILFDQSKFVDPKRNRLNNAFNNNYTIDVISIHHYVLKSYEEAIIKYNRGRADTGTKGSQPTTEYNHHNNKYNEIENRELPNKYYKTMMRIHSIIHTNADIYKALNEDIKHLSTEECHDHIFNHALNENRNCHIVDKYPNFNRDLYRKNYRDLQNLNDTEIEVHYIRDGVRENRICNRLI